MNTCQDIFSSGRGEGVRAGERKRENRSWRIRVRAAESEIHEFDSSRDRDGIGLGEGAVSRAARDGDFVQWGGSKRWRAKKTRRNCYNQACLRIRIEHGGL